MEGDDSALVQLVTHDIFPPAVPSGLQAVFSSVGQKPFIDLTWAPNTESDLAGYIVYRRTGSRPLLRSPVQLKLRHGVTTMCIPDKKYYYTVSAVDVRGNQSAQSAPASEIGAPGGSMKFCRFLGMEGPRFGLVETRDGQDFIVSELGSPQMQVERRRRAGADRVARSRSDDRFGRSARFGGKTRLRQTIDPPFRWNAPSC